MSSRPRGPLPSNARGEKSVAQNGRFSAASGKQFRSLADRWRFSAIGHAGPASCKGSAGAYLILCSHTALCSEWSRGKEPLTICPASSKNGPRDLRSNPWRSKHDDLDAMRREVGPEFDILLDAHGRRIMPAIDPRAELLLFSAARAQLVVEVIQPALDRGAIVIADRFFDSSTAYQGAGRDLDEAWMPRLHAFATAGLSPDQTYLIDVDLDTATTRRGTRGEDRMEASGTAFFDRVISAYRELAASSPDRVVVVDGRHTIEDQHLQLCEILQTLHIVQLIAIEKQPL